MTRSVIPAAAILCLISTSRLWAQSEPIRIQVDLTDSPRKLFQAELDIPAQPGPLTLTELKWIPGHHTPVGPVHDMVDVVFTANGQVLPWKRDEVDIFEYHLSVPAGVHTIHAHLDCIVTHRNVSNVVALEWENVMLLPAGAKFRDQMLEPTVTVPAGWAMASALTPTKPYDVNRPDRQTVQYKPVSAETLQDSPLFTGQYAHEYALAPEVTPRHYLDVFAPRANEVEVRPKVIDGLSNLVRETGALYRSRHYNSYHFLLTLTRNGGGGTEHHESSDNGMLEDAMATDQLQWSNAEAGQILGTDTPHSVAVLSSCSLLIRALGGAPITQTLQTVQQGSSTIELQRYDYGGVGVHGLNLEQRRPIVRGVYLVRSIDFFDDAHEATLSVERPDAVRVQARGNYYSYDVRVDRVYFLKPWVYF